MILRSRSAVVLGLALASHLTACGRVFEYPAETTENSAALCSDGADNDFDGSADCDDIDCDGFCHEESASECSDGRDNDGDGLADAADPRCWLKTPPKAERCAEARGVEIFETFDGDDIGFADPSSSWQVWGPGSVNRIGHQSPLRSDPMLSLFQIPPDPNAAVTSRVVRQRPFAGSWQDFELAFSASVPPQALLRVSIAPVARVPSLKPPLASAGNALFAVTLDAVRSPPTLALDVDGVQTPIEVMPTQALCGATLCKEYFLRFRVVWDGAGFRATLTYPNGTSVELHAPAPQGGLSLEPSRLLVTAGSARYEMPVLLDDLSMSVKPEWPCGFQSPALAVESCELPDGMEALGHTVSTAKGPDGHYCALVTASHDDETGPERLTAWSSDNGERWSVATSTSASPIELPEGVELVGAGVAADDSWHAVLSYRDDGEVRLGYSDGNACEQWGPLERGATLFPDAESPSYVVADGHHDVYFTRPPGEDRSTRTLWRVRRETPESPPEELAKLDLDVAAPVTVQRVGETDLVLVYPVLPGSGPPGVGFLVRTEDGRWQRLQPSPTLKLPGTFDAFPGDKLAFDDKGVASAALAWSGDEGILLYAGRSSDGLAAPSRLQPLRSELAVGVARLGSASGTSKEPIVPPRTCGDGACDEHEDSVRCEADCPAEGAELLGDALADRERWQTLSSELEPSKIRYLTDAPPALNWTSGEPTWSVLALERAVTGDFELSFDLFVGYTDPTRETCSLYVGLGTAPDLAVDTSNNDVPTNPGLFARADIDSDCPSRFHLQPVVLGEDVESSEIPDKASCLDEPALRSDAWHHVVLQRRGNDAIIQTPREDGCGLVQIERTFSGSGAGMPALLVGFGGASFESCRRGEPSMDVNDPNTGRAIGPQASRGTIRNIKLRSLEAEP